MGPSSRLRVASISSWCFSSTVSSDLRLLRVRMAVGNFRLRNSSRSSFAPGCRTEVVAALSSWASSTFRALLESPGSIRSSSSSSGPPAIPVSFLIASKSSWGTVSVPSRSKMKASAAGGWDCGWSKRISFRPQGSKLSGPVPARTAGGHPCSRRARGAGNNPRPVCSIPAGPGRSTAGPERR